jgi:hypothetical protein
MSLRPDTSSMPKIGPISSNGNKSVATKKAAGTTEYIRILIIPNAIAEKYMIFVEVAKTKKMTKKSTAKKNKELTLKLALLSLLFGFFN